MAGGKGTRLRPLTCGIPKPMVPIFDKPVMEYTLELLKKHGFYNIGVTLSYLPQSIMDYFGKGEKQGLNIEYFIEKKALGTGGSVRNTDSFLNGTFIVISGDALTDLDITKAIAFHNEKKSKATIVLRKESIPVEYGIVITGTDGRIKRFLEKPSWGEVFSDTINTGIYILEPEVLRYYKKGDIFDFSKDLFPILLKENIPMYGYVTEDYWCDIGDLLSYRQTHFDIFNNKISINFNKKEIEEKIYVGKDVFISDSAKLKPPLYIGNGSIVENEAIIDSYSVISDNCRIGEGSKIKRSVLWRNVEVGDFSNISGSILCNNLIIKNRINIFENTAIGQNSVILENSTIKPGIKIWPEKKINESTIISHNLVWGTKSSKNIFGLRGITGIVNQEITSELSSELGSVFALTVDTGSNFVISSDGKSQSEIVKGAVISGISSAGARCCIIENSIIPMTRFAIEYFKAAGGIHIFTSSERPFTTHIEFYDDNGVNINRTKERNIENLLNTGDYNRCKTKDISAPVKIENFKEIFINQGIELLQQKDAIRRKSLKILVFSKSLNAATIAEEYLRKIGCDVSIIIGKDELIAANYKNADLSLVIMENGEEVALYDAKCGIIKNENYMLFSELVAIKGFDTKEMVFPCAFPTTAEDIANRYKIKIHRTPSDISSIMNKIIELNKNLKLLNPQLILNYNGIWALGYILSYLATENKTLFEVYSNIPKFHFSQKEIPCKWNDKGKIIRTFADRINAQNEDMIEGVRFKDHRGWSLVLPDNEKPVFNIYTQGATQELAKELTADLIDRINELLNSED